MSKQVEQCHISGVGVVTCQDSLDPGAPSGAPAIDQLLAKSRIGLDRVHASDLEREMAAGALVVDTRPADQRERDGELPGAVVIDRNVLEWRLDPSSPHRLPIADDPARRIVVVCNEGYSSSLAAYTLQQLGLSRATDLIGGFQAWQLCAISTSDHLTRE
ncbi:rhodanese-related sulfurtransferase [Pseudarthrobacter defluvii]|uniref:rhodanese-like domain-containing protein n=1 Tax=Pseudarthrobacter defluvii TaxID=410837 RepID=UPI002785C5A5|nr:rhodanese-like domain-containing protein [Pseudarthrobacter defluvii]MDQ0771162.1 rhodanese-related sulfurtransferase [Pseudarthrobacter defluvii]